jgi:uncharacterized coiled-coil DUF342 family protein
MPAAVAAAPKPSRVQKVAPVDRKYYENKIDELDSEIKELKKKSEALSKEISSKSEGKDNFYAQKDAIKGSLDAAQNKLNELEKKRNNVQEQIKKIQQADKDSRTEMQKMQKDIGFQSEEQIDKQIADIEYQMHTESLTLKREKELMIKISQLKQVKPQLNKLMKMKDSQSSGTTGETVGSLKVQLAEIQKELAVAKDERQKHSAALGKLLDARKKSMSGVSHIFDEREKISGEIKKKLGEIKALKDERSEKIKAFNEYMANQKEARAEREKAEKAAKDAEREVRKRELDLDLDKVAPFQKELDLIENMIKHCQKLQPNVAESGPATKAPIASIEGTAVLVSKKERDEVFFVAPSKKAGAKKEAASGTVSAEKPLTHSLETLSLFAEIKVTPPTAGKDIPAVIEQLHKKTEEFKVKQAKETEDRKSKRAEREAALKEAVAAYEKAAAEAKKFAPKTEEDF